MDVSHLKCFEGSFFDGSRHTLNFEIVENIIMKKDIKVQQFSVLSYFVTQKPFWFHRVTKKTSILFWKHLF